MSEPLDRNKTVDTHAATASVISWLDGLGCKPIETEVGCGSGWIADVASVWSPTVTEAKRAKLLNIVDQNTHRDSYEKLTWLNRRLGGRMTIVVEVKTSRSDYLRDNGRKYGVHPKRATIPAAAHLMILAGSSEVFAKDMEPTGWGRLLLNRDMTRVVKFQGPWSTNPVYPGQIEDVIYGIAERRDHHTRYQGIRRFMKAYRRENAEFKERTKEAAT